MDSGDILSQLVLSDIGIFGRWLQWRFISIWLPPSLCVQFAYWTTLGDSDSRWFLCACVAQGCLLEERSVVVPRNDWKCLGVVSARRVAM